MKLPFVKVFVKLVIALFSPPAERYGVVLFEGVNKAKQSLKHISNVLIAHLWQCVQGWQGT